MGHSVAGAWGRQRRWRNSRVKGPFGGEKLLSTTFIDVANCCFYFFCFAELPHVGIYVLSVVSLCHGVDFSLVTCNKPSSVHGDRGKFLKLHLQSEVLLVATLPSGAPALELVLGSASIFC